MIQTRSTLSHEHARAVYDRIGRKQDTQRFYEDPATQLAVSHADLSAATSVLEFGSGTGRFAAAILEHHLSRSARYLGVDVSPTMVAIATERLARFGDRAQARVTDGSPRLELPAASFDRFLSNYVLDLLSDEDIRAVLDEAHRLLTSRGIIAFVSLTHGFTVGSRIIESAVVALHSLRPSLVGGCRPIDLLKFIGEPSWRVRYQRKLTAFMIPSEIVVAQKITVQKP